MSSGILFGPSVVVDVGSVVVVVVVLDVVSTVLGSSVVVVVDVVLDVVSTGFGTLTSGCSVVLVVLDVAGSS